MNRIRSQITTIIILSIMILSIILLSFSVSYSSKVINGEIREKLNNLVLFYGQQINNEIIKKENSVRNLHSIVLNTFDYDKYLSDDGYVDEVFEEYAPIMQALAYQNTTSWIYMNPFLKNQANDIWFFDYDRDGVPERQERLGLDYFEDKTGKEWFFVPYDTKEPYWSEPYDSTVFDDVKWQTFSMPVIINNEVIAVIGSDDEILISENELFNLNIAETGYGFLLNDKFEFIYHPAIKEKTSLREFNDGQYLDMAEEMENKVAGLVEYEWIDGSNKILAFTRLNNGWYLAVTTEKSVISSSINLYIFRIISLTILSIVISIVLAYMLSRKLTKPIEILTKEISSYSEGNYNRPIPSELIVTKNEIGILASNVELMRLKQKEYFNKINEHNKNLENLVSERTYNLKETNQELELSIESLKKTQKQLIDSKKGEAMSHMLVEISKRMHTPLSVSFTTISYIESIVDEVIKGEIGSLSEELNDDLIEINNSIPLIKKNIAFSSRIIDNILQLSNEYTSLNIESINLREFLVEMKAFLSVYFSDEFNYKICIDCPEQILIKTYPSILLKAFQNLIQHSLSFEYKNIDECSINISVKATSNQIIINYEASTRFDYNQYKDNIFEPFAFPTAASTINGLELFITNNLIIKGLEGKILFKGSTQDMLTFKIALKKDIHNMDTMLS